MSAAKARNAPFVLGLFMISIVLSVSFELAGVRLTPTRIVLLVMAIPVGIQFLSGRLGKITAGDGLLFFLCIWMVLSLVYHEGAGRLAYATISVVELFVSYMLGRYVVRNAADFRAMVKWHLFLLVVLLPFALVEFTSGTQYWAQFLDNIGDVQYRQESSRPRFGFNRVLTGFEHPILYGIFCSMVVGTVFYIWRPQRMLMALLLAFAGGMAFMSLSAGAVLAVGFQVGLIIWGLMSGNRWLLLTLMFVGGIAFLEVFSGRGSISIFISTFAFDGVSAWTRVTQWEYGTAEVWRNPIFGKGITSDWIRPAWLYTSSIDNYWLVVAFRHGFPAIIAHIAGVLLILVSIARAKSLPEEVNNIRTGYLIVMAAVCFCLVTVHIWDSNVIFFFFYLGAGVWIANHPPTGEDDEDGEAEQTASPDASAQRYSRFTPSSDTVSARSLS